MDIQSVKKWATRLLELVVLLYVFAGVALRASIVTHHHWVGVVSMCASLVLMAGVLIKIRMRLEDVPIRTLLVGFLSVLFAQAIFVASLRMPHSVASCLFVIAAIISLPFISSQSEAQKAAEAAARAEDQNRAKAAITDHSGDTVQSVGVVALLNRLREARTSRAKTLATRKSE